jgi:DNA-binding CsgD family transcriptional regulator
MGRRGRPPHPDILTPREWEVLDLLRERLTNEQIAERLGITLDGAKYHVSEILSKLGVATREEAAAWTSARVRPSWQRLIALPVAAKVAGVLTLVTVAAGLGVLAWGVAETGGPPEQAPSGVGEPVSSSVPADCRAGTPAELDGQPACSFSFEVTDVPAQLEGWMLRADGGTNVSMLYTTCVPEGSCRNFAGPVSEERHPQPKWTIDRPATITVIAPERVSTVSIPVDNLRLLDFTYSHPCTAEFPSCHRFVASYGLLDSYVPDLSKLDPDDPLARLSQGLEKIIEEQQKPGFVGDKLGIFIDAAEEEVDIPPQYVTAEDICPPGAPHTPVALEQAGELAFSLNPPPEYTTVADDMDDGAVACGDVVYVAKRVYQHAEHGGRVVIGRARFTVVDGMHWPAESVKVVTLAGREAILFEPIYPERSEPTYPERYEFGGQSTQIVFPEPFGMTFIITNGVDLADVMTLGELVAEATR